ncbi:MAG: DUF6651 domain-containing protein [Hyphomicrobium sp.]|uniref:DUF6651 domain-containing protein n=1 Tax=Hyphomicrobium sp. TaxID=82 RepID=UPI00356A5254
MRLKTVEHDGKTYAEVADGKPVYVADDGTETAVDLPGTAATISRLNGEAKGHRERAEAAERTLKTFEGLDAAKARDALEKLSTIDQKKLIDAGEVEKVKAEIQKALEVKIADAEKRATDLEGQLYSEKIGGAFKSSEFIKNKIAIPSEFVESRFGNNFKIEDGKVVAFDQNGNKIYSAAKPGELADFDEALSILVNANPQRDNILKGTGSNGTGAKTSNGGGGNKNLSGLSPVERINAARGVAR